jgi:flagellar hook assembly protein FlgD
MKAILLVIFSFSLLYSGSTTAISNQFSLGSVDVKKKQNPKHDIVSSNTIKMIRRNDGVLFKMDGAERIHSLSIIRTNGSIVKSFSTAGVESVFWDGCASYGAKLPNGCYIAVVNKTYTKAIILSGKASEK